MIKEVRNFFNTVFGGTPKPQSVSQVKLMNEFTPSFYNFSGNIYEADIIRACIHSIAFNASKLKPKHLINGVKQPKTSNIERLLAYQPNEFMNTSDFIYKIVSMLYTSNNVFVYIRKDDKGVITGFYPINYSQVTFVEADNELYAQFIFKNSFRVTLHISELIHLKRHFNESDYFGSQPATTIKPTIDLLNLTQQGISNAIQSSSSIRGILKLSGQYRPEDLKKKRDEFVTNYLNLDNNGGIGALDSVMDFVPTEIKPYVPDFKQNNIVIENICRYYNISKEIVFSNYTEEQYLAFYNSVLEPLLVQMGLEFTNKIFTPREIGFGNEIVLSADRMTFANNKTRTEMISALAPFGILSINEARAIIELPPVEDGEKRLISLNNIDIKNADEYQIGKGKSKDKSNKDDKTKKENIDDTENEGLDNE